MANSRTSRMGAALLGATAMLLLVIVIGAIVVFGGLYPAAASKGYPPGVAWVLEQAMERSVRRAADGLQAPNLTKAAIEEGGSHFKAMCQRCHGGPGVEAPPFARAMDPKPPELAHAAREWSKPEIFWIVKNGIKMTGMPAFGEYEGDGELWKIAAFVEQLPNVSGEEYSGIPAAGGHAETEGQGGEGHGH